MRPPHPNDVANQVLMKRIGEAPAHSIAIVTSVATTGSDDIESDMSEGSACIWQLRQSDDFFFAR